jgi:chromosome segregation ATPase
MEKMAHAAERVTELGRNYKIDVRNLEKRWRVLKQWSDDYSLELQRIVKEWKAIKQEQDLLVEWLDPNEKQLTKINEKINWADEDGMKKQITDLKVWLCLICENFHDITELSIVILGYPLLYGLCPLFKLGEMCL